MKNYDVAIIGAGFAGASTAWHLSKASGLKVAIFDSEEMPGMHASSQNASMMRQFEEDREISPSSVEGARFLRNPPEHWGSVVDLVGSLILFKKNSRSIINETQIFEKTLGLDVQIISKEDACKKVSFLKNADFDNAVWTESDGVVDINLLLWSYLKDAKKGGTEFRFKEAVTKIKKDGSAFRILTEKGEVSVGTIVNASGAWASKIAEIASASPIKITPYRRHLYSTKVMKDVDPKLPFVWDITHMYYFRPESGGLLLGPCDEEVANPGVPSTAHHVKELLAEKLQKYCPSLADIEIAREWAGLRTFAKDRRFVIGEDPELKSFIWVAGLGGFGVTTSFVVGKLAADAVLNGGQNIPKSYLPGRFGEV